MVKQEMRDLSDREYENQVVEKLKGVNVSSALIGATRNALHEVSVSDLLSEQAVLDDLCRFSPRHFVLPQKIRNGANRYRKYKRKKSKDEHGGNYLCLTTPCRDKRCRQAQFHDTHPSRGNRNGGK
jgi:hypothetical protein